MERIDSFTVNHLKLKPGLYVSRKDRKNDVVTTFDLRFISPNTDGIMDTGSVHTIEHLGATFLRNSQAKSDVVYFGPMGCRTGFYLVMFGDLVSQDEVELVKKMCEFIITFEGDIPGATAIECGNYKDQNLDGAKKLTLKYLEELNNYKRYVYEN